jgi:hypothetical protein
MDEGAPVAISYPVTTTSTRYVNGALDNSNFQFISFDRLSDDDHTLVVRVTQCQNHAFVFDYITYTPSFANLASMPNLTFTPSADGSTSTTSITASPIVSQVLPQFTGPNTTLVGAIVGCTVGGLLAFSFMFFWLRRRTSKKNKEKSALPFDVFQTERPAESVFLIYVSFFLVE